MVIKRILFLIMSLKQKIIFEAVVVVWADEVRYNAVLVNEVDKTLNLLLAWLPSLICRIPPSSDSTVSQISQSLLYCMSQCGLRTNDG